MSEKRKESIKPSIIAVIVLVVIALISGALLSILQDVLFVSNEERTARALKKVYASESYTDIEINAEYKERTITYYYFKTNKETQDTTTVTGLYRADDGTIIIGASGVKSWNEKGFAEIMMAVGDDGVIKAAVVSTFNGDDKATSVNQKYINNTYVGKNVFDNPNFTMRPTDSTLNNVDISAGATARTSMESVASAMSMAVWYLNQVDILGGAQ